MFHRPRVLMSCVLLFASIACADPAGATTPLSGPGITSPAPELREKSTGVALLWAIGATTLPIVASSVLFDGGDDALFAVTTAALLIGPSAGQFYAGSHANGFKGMGIRAAAVPVGLLVGSVMASGADGEGFSDLATFLGGFVIGGGITWAVGTAYSLIDAHRAVNRHNARVRTAFDRMSLAPTLVPVSDGRTVTRWAPGLAFTASF